MKRIISGLLAVAMLAVIAMVYVSAAEFVPSAEDRNPVVNNETATINGQSLTSYGGRIVPTSYADRAKLPVAAREALEIAHQELTDGIPNVSGNYKVGAHFDIAYEGNDLPETYTIKVDIQISFGNANVSCIYKNLETGKWENTNCVYKDGIASVFLNHFCPIAFLIEDGSVIITDPSQDSPQTGDDLSPIVIAVGAIILSGAAVAVVFSRKRQSI